MHQKILLPQPLSSSLGSINLCAQFSKNTERMRTWRKLSTFALIFILRGEGIFKKPNSPNEEICSGSCIWLVPGESHFYSPSKDWDEFFIVFEGPLFELGWRQGLFATNSHVFKLHGMDSWKKKFQRIFAIEKKQKKTSRPTASLTTIDLFQKLSILFLTLDEKSKKASSFLEMAQNYLHPFGLHSMTPLECSRQLRTSYSHFRHRFKKESGESPEKYKSRQKIIKACQMLDRKELSIKQIAEDLGYYDEFHFSKVFKSHLQCSPSLYRKVRPSFKEINF